MSDKCKWSDGKESPSLIALTWKDMQDGMALVQLNKFHKDQGQNKSDISIAILNQYNTKRRNTSAPLGGKKKKVET